MDQIESLCKDYLRNLFYGLKFLRVLQVENVYVETLPDVVGNLVHLRYLCLKNSCLNELPDSISNLSNLQTLDISGNGMQTLPNGVCLTQLRELAEVDLTEAEDESEIVALIMKMKGLLSLSLRVEINSLELFSPPPLLQKLKLTGCLVDLPNWLGSMENLTKLILFNSQLSENPTTVLQ
ncbi:putative disease resistance RPP13-like protein 2 [Telopea speciosissima]|uniref:putative disease resistance RPP13-like protein 2 n=1 Tax=Telopea speciosissima TaxID=54955 RepID=UPI001CC45E6B|nr:putative disease resistance RPP13-like protein 2 [Telopea speciosissima]